MPALPLSSFRGSGVDHQTSTSSIRPPGAPRGRGKTTDGPIGTGLHKIGLPDAYYRMENGKMYNGLLTVAYQLQDVDPEQGGL